MKITSRIARAIAVVTLAGAASASVADGAHWSYAAHGDAGDWAQLSKDYAACAGAGHEQSPIDISTKKAVHADVAPVALHWTAFKPEVVNNGHTVQVNANGGGGHATLDGTDYELLQFHFHALSEHTIDGKHSPMEVHFVGKSKAGDLLVIGAMIEDGADNKVLDAVLPLIPSSEGRATSAATIDPNQLLPAGAKAYRYAGSLTTPPCSEIVTWNVLAEPVTASSAQIEAFAAMFPNSFRPTQDLARRFVLSVQ